MKYLFVVGCPRSGTTAMRSVLIADPRIVLGLERYKYTKADVRPEHFAPAKLLTPDPSETNWVDPEIYAEASVRFARGTVEWVGDKSPLFVVHLRRLRERFTEVPPRFVVMVRDPLAVASSFQSRADDPEDAWPPSHDHAEAARMWNACGQEIEAYIERYGDDELLLVSYEGFFSGDRRWRGAVECFLGIEPSRPYRRACWRATRGWSQARTAARHLGEDARRRVDDLVDHRLRERLDVLQQVGLLRWAPPTLPERLRSRVAAR